MQPSDTPTRTSTHTSTGTSRSRRWLFGLVLPLLILVVAIAAFLALKASRPEPPRATPEERAWLVDTAMVTPSTQHPLITLYGEVANPDRLTVRAPLSARVESVPVEDGSVVAAGRLLVALDPRDFQPALERARASLADLEAQIRETRAMHESDQAALKLEQEIAENAETALKRNRDLRSRNLASQANVDSARDVLSQARLSVSTRRERLATFEARLAGLEARRDAAAADVAVAQRDLERAQVAAPAAGLVGQVAVTAGALVNANAVLLDFFPWDGFELRALIPSGQIAALAAALEAGATPRAYSRAGNHRLRLDRLAGEASGMGVTGLFEFARLDSSLRVGQVLSIELELPPVDNAVAIPHSALYGNDHVYRIRDNRLEQVSVERLGATDDGALLIRAAGLSAGDRIATTQLPNAIDGLKVAWRDGTGQESSQEFGEAGGE